MDKSLVTGLVIGAVFATAGGAVANLKLRDARQSAAEPQPVAQLQAPAGAPALETHSAAPQFVVPAQSQAAPTAMQPGYPTQNPYMQAPPVQAAPVQPALYAEVLDVDPVTRTVRTPRQVCHEEQVTRELPTRDDKRVTGAILGAAIGGVLGNQVGGGDGRTIATAAGAAAGGYAGSKIQKRMQAGNTYTTTEQRCSTTYDTRQERIGYDVRYSLDGRVGTVRMDREPGARIPVVDGQLVLRGAPVNVI